MRRGDASGRWHHGREREARSAGNPWRWHLTYDVIVIGAGSNGLTAAAVLAKHGRKVLVLESAAEVGGMRRAVEFAPGFRASLDADPGWISPAVEKVIAIPHARIRRGPRIQQVVASDNGDGHKYQRLLEQLARFADVLGALYQLSPPDIDTTSPGEILPLLGVALKTKALGRKEMIEFLRVMPMSIQDLADDTLKDESLKAMLAAAAVRDLRQGPRSAGTTFNLIHRMIGAPPGMVHRFEQLPGGPAIFARIAAETARAAGVEIRLNARVERISVSSDSVNGVVLAGGEEIAASQVISTADPKRTLLGLVDPVWLDPEFMLAVKNIKMRGCAAFILYGVGGSTDEALGRSLTTSTVALEKAADAAKYGEISEHPHVELFAPSARESDLGLAPDGKSVFVARVQYAPYALKGGWDAAKADSLAKKVTAAMEQAIPGFSSRIEQRAVLTPRDLEEKFGVTEGALTHGELTLDQILFMRPVPGWGHYEMPVRGLFLGGAGAHPGPGILGGAGLLAARAALRHR